MLNDDENRRVKKRWTGACCWSAKRLHCTQIGCSEIGVGCIPHEGSVLFSLFAPSVGGTETIVLSIARGLSELRTSSGLSEFEITLVTETVVYVHVKRSPGKP